ncbi:NifB/NifX family molybdenum-iron cluster-binding protein [Zongyangia hominis]|uniref:NifB/NifX family molybdenum-iron cluster-binding protein n=1 Tax=Zongyangia hominis TaxID=2763677 RepID=A0A926I6R5_9FIRM|nr:NifB/NifX family molybdenum-iron cluster-binding protein [Zongyangia hominis]MBC8570329.1 NifB/NifX family molybdenum-iron cluster-binding protein [Zongyangia hominis]
MKLAITTENNQVFQHFGKTKTFTVYTVEDGEIKGKGLLSAGDAGHSALVDVLRGAGVELLICGGIGQGAKDALTAAGLSFISGAAGDVDAVVRAYLAGELHDDPTAQCNHHHGHGHEEGHTCGSHGCH